MHNAAAHHPLTDAQPVGGGAGEAEKVLDLVEAPLGNNPNTPDLSTLFSSPIPNTAPLSATGKRTNSIPAPTGTLAQPYLPANCKANEARGWAGPGAGGAQWPLHKAGGSPPGLGGAW